MIKLIITDIGGVLVKTDRAIIQCIEKVFQENNIPLGSRDKLLSAFGVSIFDYVKNYLPEGYKDKASYCYEEFKKIYPSKATHLMKVFPQTNETLRYIKNKHIIICVLSCMIKQEVQVNLSLLDFKDFEIVFSLGDYAHKRPLPNGLNMIMKKLNVLPSETIYIGDTVNDIKMAKNAGVISIAVKTGAQENNKLEQARPDYLLKNFSKIKEILN
jgi:phosphoglycolate phosphatase-like HAD superfamily hydrolase